jgi:methylthioribose-1-phosphate isomerase
MTQTLESIRYSRGTLEILDQLQLPFTTAYEKVKDTIDGHHVIKTMKTRGAPAIAITAALSLAVEVYSVKDSFTDADAVAEFLHSKFGARVGSVVYRRSRKNACE